MKRISAPAKPSRTPAAEIMTVDTLAIYLHCYHSFIYRLLAKRKMPAFRVGSDWRFFRSAIDDWIARQYDTTNPPLTKARKSKVS